MESILSRLPRSSRPLALGLLGLALAAAPALAQQSATEGGIQVSGTGEVSAVPDMARVSLEVRREGRDAAALKAELDDVTAAILDLGGELDIAERDVTAAAVNIYPRYVHDDGEARTDGVIASRSIEFTVRELDRLADLINGALERGANGIGGVQLEASKRRELEREALDLAIDDAVEEARRVAQRFGVALGPLTAASTQLTVQPPRMMEAMSMRSSAPDSFAPGELVIRQSIQATFAIRP